MSTKSLALLSKRALEKFKEVIGGLEKAWNRCVDGRCRALIYFFERLGELSAQLVGAAGDEVMAMLTTANLHQLAATFFEPRAGRNKILAE